MEIWFAALYVQWQRLKCCESKTTAFQLKAIWEGFCLKQGVKCICRPFRVSVKITGLNF